MNTLTRNEVSELIKLRTHAAVRRSRKFFLIEGVKLLQEAVASGWDIGQLVVTSASARRHAELISSLGSVTKSLTDSESMARLSGTKTPPELVALVSIPETTFEQVAEQPLIACLDGVADPGNLGTIIRTAEWFGVTGLILSSAGVDPYNDKVVRASMGSLFRMKVWQSKNLAADLALLKKNGTKLLVSDVREGSSTIPRGPLCLVMGSESHGVSPEISALASSKYTIPGSGQAESLNVAVSFGIALHDITAAR